MSQSRIQDARAVAYRAFCLGALLYRGESELAVQNLDPFFFFEDAFEDAKEEALQKQRHLNKALLRWLSEEKLTGHLSEAEQHLLNKPLGTWTERTLISVGWRVESLGVMLWALHRMDTMPAYDAQFKLDEVLLPLDILNPTIDFIWCATLRPAEELVMMRDQAELWNWRSRATELQRMGVRPPEGVTFREIIRVTAERAYTNGHIPSPVDGDFRAFNKAYAQLNEDEYALASAVAYERYGSLSWMCELSSEWENIRVDS